MRFRQPGGAPSTPQQYQRKILGQATTCNTNSISSNRNRTGAPTHLSPPFPSNPLLCWNFRAIMRASVYSASATALLLLIQLPALCHAFSASRLPSLLHSRPVPALHKHSKHNFGGVQAARNNVCLKVTPTFESQILKPEAPIPHPDPITEQASAMQSDWEELVDEASGSTYYWNRVSGETSWEKPAASAYVLSSAPCSRTLVRSPTAPA